MGNENMEFTLPPAPAGLCFDRLDFVKANFSVDNFLAERQNVPLETVRDDLGAYLKVLRLSMIDLINKDYANFVNLSATLIGFDKSIEKIQLPLEQLNEEIMTVKQCLEEAMKELSLWLNQRHTLQKKKQLLKHYSQTINCLSTLDKILANISDKKKQEKILLADRGAVEINQLKFSISKCETLVKADQKSQYQRIEEKLTQTLNELLFQFWNDEDEDNLLKTLMTLASLERVPETEIMIRKKAIAPLLVDIINEPALQKDKAGLQGIYEKILALLDTKLKLLLVVTQHSKLAFLITKYRFLVNCFWCEVESRLEVNLASIFAPGNPKIFYRRYCESMEFIRKLERYCVEEETVTLLRGTAEFKSFQKRWNLPVYFQIRFQEIAGMFEATLHGKPTASDSSSGFQLKQTEHCWRALEDCWSDGVYIEALAHKFWKLSLQLILRYSTWCSHFCVQRNSPSRLESTGVNKDLINSSINMYLDSQALLRKTPQLLLRVESKIPSVTQDLLNQSLRPSEEALDRIKDKIKQCIVNELFENFNTHLKQVSDIPRLYRKTNRSVPTKPCTYIDVVTKSFEQFHKDVEKKLDNGFLVQLYEALFNVMTASYYKYVEDVLTSVQKTEESLRRLKQIRDRTAAQSNENSGITDGDKIRLQLKVDIVAYEQLATNVNVDIKFIEKYKELNTVVTEAVKTINIK